MNLNKKFLDMFNSFFSLQEKKYKLVFLIIISFLVLFHRLGESTLGYDDVYYAQRAKEMIHKKDWFYTNPTIGGQLSFDNKPPMLFWFLSLVGKLFNFNNWSMRLFPAIFGFLCILVMFCFVSNLYGYYTGFISSFVLLFTQQFLYYSRSATMETMFSLFFFLALISFWNGYYYNKEKSFYLTGLFIGLAILTRQLSGLLIYAVIIVFLALVKDKKVLKQKSFYLGILLSFMISFPWHLYMVVKHGNKFVTEYFSIVSRGITKSTNWYEYIRKILENYWPWLPFLVLGIYKSIKNMKTLSSDEQNKLMFIFSFTFVPLFILHILKFKAVQYLVPVYIPFAIIVGKTISDIDVKKNFLWSKIFVSLGVILTVLWLCFPIIPNTLDSSEFKDTIKLIPYIKNIPQECNIYIIDDGEKWHYFNGLLFYADKKPVVLSKQEFVKKIFTGHPNEYFVLNKKSLNDSLLKSFVIKMKIVKETKNTLLITSKI